MTNKEKILTHVIDYLKAKVPDFKINTRTKRATFTCPVCKYADSALIPTGTYKVRCVKCNKTYGDIIDLVKLLEPDKCSYDEEEILEHLVEFLKLPLATDNTLDTALDFFEKRSFDLVPIARNQKNPIEMEWTKKVHRSKEEWKSWLNDGLNIGIKTGQCSNITVIDVDQEEIPPEVNNLLPVTLYQKTNKGHHIFFKYTPELTNTRVDELKIDILNDGKQCVSFPSVVDGVVREINLNEVAEMPKELLTFFKSKISVPVQSFSERIKDDIKTESFNGLDINLVNEGSRNNFLLHFGGILRKELNISQTAFALQIINKNFCRPPLVMRELDAIIGSLDRYLAFDEQELALKILQYMKVVEEAGSRDIREALGELGAEGKQRIEKAIKYLVKEGFILKKKRIYHIIRKADWKQEFEDDSRVINYQMPYFHDCAIFRNSDMVIIGGSPKIGKSHIALNIIKKLVEQGKKPYYISLESGNRFVTIAHILGLKEGDFYWAIHFSPETIELEKDAITIIDWILPNDYAETDKLFKHFAEQLVKNGGTLIAFVQLKDNNTFFAPSMISMFPALVARYMYEKEGDGTLGHFQLDYIREPMIKMKKAQVLCQYDFENKTLERLETVMNKDTTVVVEEVKEDRL